MLNLALMIAVSTTTTATTATTATAATTESGSRDCSFAKQSMVTGHEYREASPADEYSAVRHEDPCEYQWLALQHGDSLEAVERNLDQNPGEAVPIRFQTNDREQALYVEVDRYRYQRFLAAAYGDTGRVISEARVSEGRASIYRPLCLHDCTTGLGPGRYYLALGKSGDPLAEIQQPLDLSSPVLIEGHLRTYNTERLIGAGTMTAGLVTAFGGVVWVVVNKLTESTASNVGPAATIIAGASVAVAGGVTLAIFYEDEARLEITPWITPGAGVAKPEPR